MLDNDKECTCPRLRALRGHLYGCPVPEAYNGWANRETWAVALHINNDQGWQESVLETVRNAVDGVMQDPHPWQVDESGQASTEAQTAAAAGAIRENVEESLAGDVEASDFAGNPVVQYTTEQDMAREDIGSLWRVDWTELGAAFLSDLEEQS